MQKTYLFSIIFLGMLSSTCSNTAKENTPSAKAPVHITAIKKGTISDSLAFSATTFYLSDNKITAPVNGYLTQAGIQAGDEVRQGQILFELQTREARALQAVPDSVYLPSDLSNLGSINVKAPSDGLLTAVSYVKDDFVQEGNVLATLVSPDHLYLKLFVPFEYRSVIHRSDTFPIELPAGTSITATVVRPLNQTDNISQSVLWLLKPNQPRLIPEGLKLTVHVPSARRSDTQLLPKEAVLANETLDSFWVMKVINDTLAIRVPVKKGLETGQRVEILNPKFAPSDKIIISGQYGLEDSSSVQIVKSGS